MQLEVVAIAGIAASEIGCRQAGPTGGALSMECAELELAGVKLLKPKQHGDSRGFFSETYNRRLLAELGIVDDFVQDNHSLSAVTGTIRGLHFQSPPHGQAKLIRVVKGSILDVVVDLRRSSPTFGRHLAVELSAAAWNQLYVPIGMAHGFCTLQADTEIIYKVSTYYAPDHDRGLLWNDPALGIDWPVAGDRAMLSDKDRRQPLLADIIDELSF